jgi:hypothetical protein
VGGTFCLQRILTFGGALGLAAGLGCKVIDDIGESVDRGATKVVKAGSNIFDGSTKTPPPPTEGEDPALTASREAYDEGEVAFSLAKYEVALEKFEASFALANDIEDPELRAQVQAVLLFNLAQAHLKSYELDDDATHLTRARDLLRNHLAADPTLSDEERKKVEQLIADVEATLARVDDDGAREE